MQLNRAVRITRIFFEARAREFYVDFLGFTVEWERGFEDGSRASMNNRGGA